MATQRVQCPRTDQTLHGLAIHLSRVHASSQTVERGKRSALVPRIQHGQNGRSADILDGFQATANLVVLDREILFGTVDVRRKHGDNHAAAIIDQTRHHACTAVPRGHFRCHELGGVIRFEVRRLIREHGVTRGVRLDKSVTGEGLHQFKDLLRQPLRHAPMRDTSLNELSFDAFQFPRVFLAHTAAQNIGAPQ